MLISMAIVGYLVLSFGFSVLVGKSIAFGMR